MCVSGLVVCLMVVTVVIGYPLRRSEGGPRYVIEKPHSSDKPFVEAYNASYIGAGPLEEAWAICSVRTHEINATANATITKRLYGVATSREVKRAFQRLEVVLFGQMQQIWQTLDALRSQIAGNANPQYPDRHTAYIRLKSDVG